MHYFLLFQKKRGNIMKRATILDLDRREVGYLDRQNLIYNPQGEVIAFCEKNNIFTFSGRFLGKMEKGRIKSLEGFDLFMTE